MSVPALAGVAANDKSATSQDRANSLVTGTIKAVGAGKAFPCWGPLNLLVYGVQAEALTITTAGVNGGTVPAGTTQNIGDSVQSTLVPPGTTIKTTDGGGNLTFAFPTQTWYGVLDGSASIKFPNGAPVGLQGSTLASLVGATVTDPNGYFGTGVTVLGVGADNQSLLLSAAPTSATGRPFLPGPVPIEFALTAKCLTAAGTDANATFVGSGTEIGADTTSFVIERSMDGGSTWVGCNIGGSGQLAKFTSLPNPLSVSFGEPEAGSLYRVNCLVFSAATRVTINYRWSTTGQAGTVLSTPAIT